jgi:hypothetical protein
MKICFTLGFLVLHAVILYRTWDNYVITSCATSVFLIMDFMVLPMMLSSLNMGVVLIINFLAWRIYFCNRMLITGALLQDLCVWWSLSLCTNNNKYIPIYKKNHQTLPMVYEQPIFWLIGFSNQVSRNYVWSEGRNLIECVWLKVWHWLSSRHYVLL